VLPNNPADANLVLSLSEATPMEYILNRIREMRSRQEVVAWRDRILVVKAGTGSGKSTAMPEGIYRTFLKDSRGVMAVTQPRVLTAMTIARDIASRDSKNMRLGDNIGWSTGPSKRQSRFGLTYMTIGSLMQQLKTMTDMEIMMKYQFVMIDEVHEMTLDLAIMLYMLKGIFSRNMNSKLLPILILTSATFSHEMFLQYFNCWNPDMHNPNYIAVQGSAYNRAKHYVEHGLTDYLAEMARLAIELHSKNHEDPPSRADILCFLSGVSEMIRVEDLLNAANAIEAAAGRPVFKPLRLMGEIVKENLADYQELNVPSDVLRVSIDGKTYTPMRKIILATTVAETGLTIDMLKYCIDSGFYKSAEYNPNHNLNMLVTRPISQFRAEQRIGRVGRKFDGEYYALYPEYMYKLMASVSMTEIALRDMSPYILTVLSEQTPLVRDTSITALNTTLYRELSRDYGPVSLKGIDLVDHPSGDTLHACWERLYALGYIRRVDESFTITRMGALSMRFVGLPLETLRMILAAYMWEHSIMDVVTIAAYLLSGIADRSSKYKWLEIYRGGLPKYLFDGKRDNATELLRVRLMICDDFIDGLILYNSAMAAVKDASLENVLFAIDEWCVKTEVPYNSLIAMFDQRDKIIEQMITAGMLPFANREYSLEMCDESDFMNTITRIKHCIYDGYRQSIMKYVESTGAYNNLRGIDVEMPSIIGDTPKTRKQYESLGVGVGVRPRILCYHSLTLKNDTKLSRYTVKAGPVSAMDGYVATDPQFMSGVE